MNLSPDALRVFFARLLLVVGVFGVIWLLRNLLTWLMSKPLQGIMQRVGVTDDESHALIGSIVLIPVRYLLLAIGIDLSARILELPHPLIDFALNLSSTLVIVALAVLLFRIISAIVISPKRFLLFTGATIDDALLPFIRTGFMVLVIAVMLVIVLQVWDYDITGLVAGLGLGGLAFSLAAQDLLSNLFGFAAVVSDRPFVVGDYIKTPDVEGSVEHVGVRSTRVRQLNQAVVYVPNSKLAAGTILNWSRLAKRWIDFKLHIEYATTAEQLAGVLEAIRAMLTGRASVDPKSIFVYFTEFADSSLNIQVRCYVAIVDFVAFTQEQELILLDVMRVLERLNVSVALPSQTIYYENADEHGSRVPLLSRPPHTYTGARSARAGTTAEPTDSPYPTAAPATFNDKQIDEEEQS
ncbi:MAG: mechanosensitive ion channel family protein [Chloroflexota bacterium]|nr:mechanosensitive ion channel family protein [Chloroflexota bacterium]